MNYFNPTISSVFTYPDMASQIERLNDKQSAGLRNAINTAIDMYKFKKLTGELKNQEVAEEEEDTDSAVVDVAAHTLYGGLDRAPIPAAAAPHQTGGQSAYDAYRAALAKRGLK